LGRWMGQSSKPFPDFLEEKWTWIIILHILFFEKWNSNFFLSDEKITSHFHLNFRCESILSDQLFTFWTSFINILPFNAILSLDAYTWPNIANLKKRTLSHQCDTNSQTKSTNGHLVYKRETWLGEFIKVK
jgi:hypothetical protein